MNRFSYFAAVLAVCISCFSVVSLAAQSGAVAFTQPVTSPTLKGNQTYMVMWQFDTTKVSNANSAGTLQLGISRDGSTNLEVIKVITESIVLSSGTYTWTVPSDVSTSNQYSLTMVVEAMPFYSPKFTIENGGTPANPPSSPAPSSPTSTSTKTPASSGSNRSFTAMATLFAVLLPIALGVAYLRGPQT